MCYPDGTQVKRQKRQHLEGVIVEARGEKKWLVRFNNVLEMECPSVGLKLLLDPRYRSGAAAVTHFTSGAIAVRNSTTKCIIFCRRNTTGSGWFWCGRDGRRNTRRHSRRRCWLWCFGKHHIRCLSTEVSGMWAKKLELIESSYNVTCKSRGIELVWKVVPDSIPESPPIEFQNIGIWEMDWDKFNNLSSSKMGYLGCLQWLI